MPITILQPTDLVSTSRAIINDNFAYIATLSGLPSAISGSQTLDFPSIPSGEDADLVITAAGVTAGSPVMVGAPAALEAGLSPSWWAGPADDQITVRLTNNLATGDPVNPVSALWTWGMFTTSVASSLRGVAPLAFPSIPSGDSAVLSFTAPGATPPTTCAVGPPSSWDDEVSWSARVSAVNTIKVIVVNNKADGEPYSPPSGSWTWVVF